MKKFSVILLIAVLAMTAVFADPINATVTVGGKATATYTVGCQTGTYGYTAPTAGALTTTFALSGATKTNAGEGLWADLQAKLAFTIPAGTANPFTVAPALTLEAFKIHNGDIWTWDLTTTTFYNNLAKSFESFKVAKKDKVFNNAEIAIAADNATNKAGTTFAWNGFSFSAAVNGTLEKDETDFYYVGMLTPNFTFENAGLTLQGAGAMVYSDMWQLFGSLALTYASDDENIAISAATDQAITFNTESFKYDVDAILNMTFTPATVNVYFANTAKAGDTNVIVEKMLSAQAIVDLSAVAPVAVTVQGLNLLNADRIFNAEATYTFVAKKFDLTAYAKDILPAGVSPYRTAMSAAGQKFGAKSTMTFGNVVVTPEVYYKVSSKTLAWSAGVKYTNEKFVVTGSVDNSYVLGADVKTKGTLSVTAGIEAEDTLVKNATIGAEYKSGNLIQGGVGSATAYCTVAF